MKDGLIIACEILDENVIKKMLNKLNLTMFANKIPLLTRNYQDLIKITAPIRFNGFEGYIIKANIIVCKSVNEIILCGRIKSKNKEQVFRGRLKFRLKTLATMYLISKTKRIDVQSYLLSLSITNSQIVVKNLKPKIK